MSPDGSRIIRKEDAVEIEPWSAPRVSGSAEAEEGTVGPITATQVEEIQRQAYEEGYAQGRQEGREAGQAEMQREAERLSQLMNGLAQPFEALDQRVEEELVTLVLAVSRHLVRREIQTDPAQIVGVVREATALLPVSARDVRLHLHPEDAQLVRDALTPTEGEAAWRIVEDPVLSRGGCKVVTDDSHVDATVENRLSALAAQMLAGEREADRMEDGQDEG